MRYRLTMDIDGDYRAVQIAWDVYDDLGDRQSCFVSSDLPEGCSPSFALTRAMEQLEHLPGIVPLFP